MSVTSGLRRLLGGAPGTAAAAALPDSLLELARKGPAPLRSSGPGGDGPLRITTIVPSFRRGSGGHMTIVNLMRELRAFGHEVSLWLEDCERRHARETRAVTQRSFAEFFGAEDMLLQTSFEAWQGADVVIATGWQTVARALLLPGASRRAYLVQDHEPDFYPASAERLFAEDTYRQGLHCIAASEWLAGLLRERYGASASHFDLAVDHEIYRPGVQERREDLVVFYARAVTPRRAVPLGLLALAELAQRRPEVEIALFGEDRALDVPFEHTNLGVLPAGELARLYRRATVGMVFSLTNPSLIGLEMMACGLACVELASESMVASFGGSGAPTLAEPTPGAICDEVERMLDQAHPSEQTRAGLRLLEHRTWRAAARQVEGSCRGASSELPGLDIPLGSDD